MKSLSEVIYLKSPIFLQNLAISLYGIKMQYLRYGGEYKHYFNEVKSHLNYSKQELNKYINSALCITIKKAAENVPYYDKLFQKHGISLDEIHSIDDLRKIPFLEKEELRKDPHKFIDSKFNRKKLLRIHTTGTTGTPLKIYCNSEARKRNFAFFNRFLEQAGINYKGKRATLWGRVIVPPEQKNPPFWRYSHFQKNLLFSSYHLTENNIPHYIDKLSEFRPDYIDSYPSSLFTIAEYAKEHNLGLAGITKGITTSAETLFPEQREVIESVFGVPIYDQYGAAEMCTFVAQCKEGKYHIHTDYGLIEFLREDGSMARPCEEAELVCTGFINPVMPLIRYRIGDRAILSDESCPCGSSFPVMEAIQGRVDDVIITPDGTRIGRLSPVLKGFPVKEAQYIQKNLEEIEVLIVRDEGYLKKTEELVLLELRKRLGDIIKIKFTYADMIPRSKGGKLKSIISHLKK